MISECCGYSPLYETDDSLDEPPGLCSLCKEHTTFNKGEKND